MEAVLLCIRGFGPAQLTGKPAYCIRTLEGVGAFAIQALKRARTLAVRWQR